MANVDTFFCFEMTVLPTRRHANAGISCSLSVCLSVCSVCLSVSVTLWYCIETAAQIELIFCIQVSQDLRYTVLGKLRYHLSIKFPLELCPKL